MAGIESPKQTAAAKRADETTRVALAHIAAETAARHEKQRKLKAARLARDAARAAEPKAVPAPRKTTRRKAIG